MNKRGKHTPQHYNGQYELSDAPPPQPQIVEFDYIYSRNPTLY